MDNNQSKNIVTLDGSLNPLKLRFNNYTEKIRFLAFNPNKSKGYLSSFNKSAVPKPSLRAERRNPMQSIVPRKVEGSLN